MNLQIKRLMLSMLFSILTFGVATATQASSFSITIDSYEHNNHGHHYGKHRGNGYMFYRPHRRQHLKRHYKKNYYGQKHYYGKKRYYGYQKHGNSNYRKHKKACHKVSKYVYDSYGHHQKISGTMCYDRYGRGYVVPGSRYYDH